MKKFLTIFREAYQATYKIVQSHLETPHQPAPEAKPPDETGASVHVLVKQSVRLRGVILNLAEVLHPVFVQEGASEAGFYLSAQQIRAIREIFGADHAAAIAKLNALQATEKEIMGLAPEALARIAAAGPEK